jgi:hypothetical protein
MGQVANGNSIDLPTNDYKDYGLSLAYTKIKGLSLTGNYYMESTRAFGPSENLHYFQFLGSYQISDSLGSNVEYLYKTRMAATDTDSAGNLLTTDVQPDPSTGKLVAWSPKWQGYALYLNYNTPIKGLSILPRYEQWYSPDPAPGALASETTLTIKYAAGPLTHYLEYRNDWMNVGGFTAAGGVTDNQYFQNTLTYGAVYTF